MNPPILEVTDLSVDYFSRNVTLHAVENIGFNLDKGRSLALVGESGCGKTTAMLALMRLLPSAGRIVSGKVCLEETDLLRLSEQEIQRIRWNKIAIVFQGAMNAFNPVQRVGDQIAEAIVLHQQMDQRQVNQKVGELLEIVGVSSNRARMYPHEYSGGMRQRAMIAMALACNPEILIADEPTTALDVMVQAQILELFQNLQKQFGLSIILVTHDLGVVAELSDSVLVMYSGKMVEYSSVDGIFNRPFHPYTQRLLNAFPDIDNPGSELASIEGYPPSLDRKPKGCYFAPRCSVRLDHCSVERPQAIEIEPDHWVACHLAGQ